ncbi:MAG: hypothetical protein GY821_17075, partial [Gammaproteobacteria bacterium]|nr:hypothetical protein [Gammaproteobacteria bacterium]
MFEILRGFEILEHEGIPNDVEDLKIKISAACASIEQEVIDRSLVEFKNRLGKCIEIGGGHIE